MTVVFHRRCDNRPDTDSGRLLIFVDYRVRQSNAAPTMIFRINNHGDPCEIEFVCVG